MQTHLPSKIISGGQTGVDQAALDAARECGIPIGGYLPKGRLTEDGPLPPDKYPELQETNSEDPAVRTEKNILHSDATLIMIPELEFEKKSPGTQLTRELVEKHQKPHLILARARDEPEFELQKLRKWLNDHQLGTLNIAGPRHSENPDLADFTAYILRRLTNQLPSPKEDRTLTIAALIGIIAPFAFTAFRIITEQSIDLLSPLLLFAAGIGMLRGSHLHLRMGTFTLGLTVLVGLVTILFHLATFKPWLPNQSGTWYPPDSTEFWLLFVSPVILTSGLLALLLSIHRTRRIKFWTRAVKKWAIFISIALLLSLYSNNQLFAQKSKFTTSEKESIDQLEDYVKQFGTSPPPAAEDEFLARTTQTEHIIQISLSDSTRTTHDFIGHTRLIPRLFQNVSGGWSSASSPESVSYKINDKVVWEGHRYTNFLKTNSGKWLRLDSEIGSPLESRDASTTPER
ncbi:MAG: putative molybdenum carrier protein [Verrucomicrobiota bacterium]